MNDAMRQYWLHLGGDFLNSSPRYNGFVSRQFSMHDATFATLDQLKEDLKAIDHCELLDSLTERWESLGLAVTDVRRSSRTVLDSDGERLLSWHKSAAGASNCLYKDGFWQDGTIEQFEAAVFDQIEFRKPRNSSEIEAYLTNLGFTVTSHATGRSVRITGSDLAAYIDVGASYQGINQTVEKLKELDVSEALDRLSTLWEDAGFNGGDRVSKAVRFFKHGKTYIAGWARESTTDSRPLLVGYIWQSGTIADLEKVLTDYINSKKPKPEVVQPAPTVNISALLEEIERRSVAIDETDASIDALVEQKNQLIAQMNELDTQITQHRKERATQTRLLQYNFGKANTILKQASKLK